MKIWIIVVLWMGFILFFSSQSGEESNQNSKRVEGVIKFVIESVKEDFQLEINDIPRLHFYVRRSAHVFLYCVLGVGLLNAFKRLGIKRFLFFAWITGTLFGGVDELVQSFRVGRNSALTDVGLDSFGVLLGVLITGMILRFREKSKKTLLS